MVKIYTRTGDKGKTSLYGGERVHKTHLRVEAYGTVDELSAAIGVAIAETQNSKLKTKNHKSKIKSELENIQSDLFKVAAVLANPSSSKPPQMSGRVEHFEKLIDEMTKQLPELRNFILPGGGKAGSLLHQARTICRRSERRIVELMQEEHIPSEILVYMNRLSDLLFTMARFVNHKEKHREILWNKYQEL